MTWDRATKQARLVWHKIFQPTPKDPLNFEETIEETLLGLKARFRVREVRYDPFQMAATAQRLTRAGLNMVEFNQTIPNLTTASQNLYELIKGQNLIVYEDDAIRTAISRAVAQENTRGWKIAKDKTSSRIDIVVALAMAALGAVQKGGLGHVWVNGYRVGSDGKLINHPIPPCAAGTATNRASTSASSPRRTYTSTRWCSTSHCSEASDDQCRSVSHG